MATTTGVPTVPMPQVPLDLQQFLELKVSVMLDDKLEKKIAPLREEQVRQGKILAAIAERRDLEKDERADAKKNSELRVLVKGVFITCGAFGGILSLAATIYKAFH